MVIFVMGMVQICFLFSSALSDNDRHLVNWLTMFIGFEQKVRKLGNFKTKRAVCHVLLPVSCIIRQCASLHNHSC